MERVRVVGRMDLAERIYRALSATGADARLATGGPSSVVAATGRDGTGIDVVGALGTCAAIKKAMPARPVVLVTAPELKAFAALAAKGSRGPDAYVVWPASGQEIMAACDRARASAGAPRPRVSWQLLGFLTPVLLGLFVGPLLFVAGVIMALAWPGREWVSLALRVSTFLGLALMLAGFAAWNWKRARTARHPRRLRAVTVLEAAVASWALFMAAAAIWRR